MTDYRLFIFADGHIRDAEELEAQDDAEAIVHAEALRAGRPAELWRRAVMVRAFSDARPDGSARP